MHRTIRRVSSMCVFGTFLVIISGCGHTPSFPNSTSMNSTNVSANSVRNSTISTSGMSNSKTIVLQLKALAQSGKVDNSSFIAGKTSIAEVEQKWGKPDAQNATGAGNYATYNARLAAFGFNHTGTIYDVRSFSKQVRSLSLLDVHTALGLPERITYPQSNQVNEIYQVNQTYQLQFIVSTDSNLVDHISVYDVGAPEPQSTQPASGSSPQSIRGVIEGFYGAPWTNQERISMFEFMQKERLNTYVYAPKGDPYQRFNWRSLYPATQLAQMQALVSEAKQEHVQFVYSISPGMTGTSTTAMNESITYSSPSDLNTLEAKINQLRSIGVNTFMLSFDDIETKLKPADQQVYGTNYARAQMELANQVWADEKQQDPGFQLWCAPTSYYGLIDGPYWQTLRSTLNPNIKVIWTGKWVLNATITTGQAKTITQLLGRKPIIWDNYPVNDYTYNPSQGHQLMMGPLQGRDATLLNNVSGYISNPMLQPDASKLALATIADYLQNPSGYQSKSDWVKSINNMQGITNPTLFQTFAEFNTTSMLNPTSFAPTGTMIAAFWNASPGSQKQLAENRLETEFRTLANLPSTLPPTIADKELLGEIQPWLTKLGEEGRGGLYALQVIGEPNQMNKQLLENQIKLINSSPYEIGNDIIAFMQKVAGQN